MRSITIIPFKHNSPKDIYDALDLIGKTADQDCVDELTSGYIEQCSSISQYLKHKTFDRLYVDGISEKEIALYKKNLREKTFAEEDYISHIISILVENGSELERTESDFLIKMYVTATGRMGSSPPIIDNRLIEYVFENGGICAEDVGPLRKYFEDELECVDPELDIETLIRMRDKLIAHRIDLTLNVNETGLLFIGKEHDIRPYIDQKENLDMVYFYPNGIL